MTPAGTNAFGQPVGKPIPSWRGVRRPRPTPMNGQACQLKPTCENSHGGALYDAFATDVQGADWTYMPYGPFLSYADFKSWIHWASSSTDPLFFTTIPLSDRKPEGLISYLNIDTDNGTIEVGHVHFSDKLKRTRAATEALYLMMANVFDLGYRRCEWKCDSLNMPSRTAARRLGFRFEGLFRNAMVYNGRNRDTAWHSITDTDWHRVKAAISSWLSPTNFNTNGQQIRRLSTMTADQATDVVSVV